MGCDAAKPELSLFLQHSGAQQQGRHASGSHCGMQRTAVEAVECSAAHTAIDQQCPAPPA